MLTLQQFSSYSAGAKYNLVLDLGTYQYSIRCKKQWIKVYKLYDFMVEVSNPTNKSNVKVNVLTAKSPQHNPQDNRFYFN